MEKMLLSNRLKRYQRMTITAVAIIFRRTPMICLVVILFFKIIKSIKRLPTRQMALGTVFRIMIDTLLERIVVKKTMDAQTAPTSPPKR